MTMSLFGRVTLLIFRSRPGLRRLLLDVHSELDARRIIQDTRKELLDLDEDQLQDIGITREQALEESKRGFWD